MGFQIRNAEGIAIPINELDKEAAAFWGHPVWDKNYITPSGSWNSTNWFDSIGWNIHAQGHYTKGWNNVKCSMMSVHTAEFGMLTEEEQLQRVVSNNLYLKPYMELIDHWAAKGYTPHKTG